MLFSVRVFYGSEVAQQKMGIIKFYEEYGEKATRQVFEASRSTVFLWKKRLKDWLRRNLYPATFGTR